MPLPPTQFDKSKLSIHRFFIKIIYLWWIIINFLQRKAVFCTIYLGEVKRNNAKLMDFQQNLILVHWYVSRKKQNLSLNAKFCILKNMASVLTVPRKRPCSWKCKILRSKRDSVFYAATSNVFRAIFFKGICCFKEYTDARSIPLIR